MTAFIGHDLIARAEQEGALKVLKKPLNQHELIRILSEEKERSRPVMVVDDDPQYLHTLASVLTQNGYRTIEAETLPRALELMQKEEPVAILLDLRLDHLDPHNNMLAIRQIDPTVLLLLFSGYHSDLSRTVAEAAPGMIDGAFTKPVAIERLLAVLANVA